MAVEEPRITDLSALEPEDFKARNQAFLVGEARYDVLPHQNRRGLSNRIWSVRNGDLQRVLEEFPTDESLLDQCALWMHAVVGKHFFPDANHRTAIALLRRLLRSNGIDPGEWSIERTERARAESNRVRQEMPPIGLDTLYERDELFRVWRRYFEDVLTVGRDRE